MKVLCVSAFCPHERADSAGVLDVHHMLRWLGRRHEVTVVCPPGGSSAPQSGLRYAARSALTLPARRPAIARVGSRGLRRAVGHALAGDQFDVAHFAFTQTLHLHSLLPPGLAAVIDEVDVAFERRRRFAAMVRNPVMRAALRWDAAKLERYEVEGVARFQGVLLRTPREAELLGRLTELPRVVVVPPWVDVSFRDQVEPRPTAPDLLFYSALWRPVNEDAALWAAREVLPLVRERLPDSRLLLVGSRPSAAVRALASNAVEVPGWVDSIAPWYERAAVALVPLRAGSGIRGKILQVLGVGRPVVSTPVGAEGIDATEGDGLFVRSEPAEIAAAVVSLLRRGEHERWHAAGRRWFDATYRWEEACAEWESMLLELACGSR